jgi:16S rRNA processing protein RimM
MLARLMVGVVTSTHGLKGEVNIFPTTDDVGRFDYLERVLLGDFDDAAELEVENVKYFKGRPILKFRGIDSIEEAVRLRGSELYVRREDAIPLEEGEYYVGDLVGCTVFDEDGNEVGVLRDILQTGANGVYVISAPGKKDVLVPAVEEFVLAKDVINKRITVRILREI